MLSLGDATAAPSLQTPLAASPKVIAQVAQCQSPQSFPIPAGIPVYRKQQSLSSRHFKVYPTVLNPLAIRFSQERISPTFSTGEEFGPAIAGIRQLPCTVEGATEKEDRLLLQVPFPEIRVIAWRPKLRNPDGTARKDPSGATLMGEERFFTLDNRRLHCLQRVAAKLWPKLCCVPVRVKADNPETRAELRKFKTITQGATVHIASSKAVIEDSEVWDWRSELNLEDASRALEVVEEEEARVTTQRARVEVPASTPTAMASPLGLTMPSEPPKSRLLPLRCHLQPSRQLVLSQ